MPKLAKAKEITAAKINFVSLVDKAANKKSFLITKAEDGAATFATFGKILKADAESHYVTGVVYEPMVEDTQGNYMTEEEITKAAHWFAKHGNQVDIQHCFQKCEGAAVVESYVAKSDMTIDGTEVKKGTWLMTMEITDDSIWNSIQKGDLTGFSMGGIGAFSEVDVELPVEKQEKPKGLIKRLAMAMGLEVVEKGAVKDRFKESAISENFYTAWYALRRVLEHEAWDPLTGSWRTALSTDENEIREALSDFTDIVTQLLTSDMSIVKSLEAAAEKVPVIKAGKSLSSKNLSALQSIYDTLGSFLSEFSEGESGDTTIKKEDDMTREETQKLIGEEIKKAMDPLTTKIEAFVKESDPSTDDGAGEGEGGETEGEDIAKMVSEAVGKAVAPLAKALEPILKSRAIPGNLNDASDDVKKSGEEQHYMTGMY